MGDESREVMGPKSHSALRARARPLQCILKLGGSHWRMENRNDAF